MFNTTTKKLIFDAHTDFGDFEKFVDNVFRTTELYSDDSSKLYMVGDEYRLDVAVPGFAKEDIEFTATKLNNRGTYNLTLKANNGTRSLVREFAITNTDVDMKTAKAKVENGLLVLSIQKNSSNVSGGTINIQVD